MACINPNSPEFKAALERTGGNPLLAEIEMDRGVQIKPGVSELFESNPELANAVYEALGFKQKQYASKLKEISERRKLATKWDLENSQLIKDIRIDKTQPKELKPNAADNNLVAIMLYGMKMSELEDKGLPEEMMEANTLAYRILNDFMFDINEILFYQDILLENPEYAQTLTTNKNPVKEFFENDIFEQVEKEKFKITPQQKQQAQQLYSQYLDTIFPDSKVKDIVYHGTKEEFENFSKDYLGKNLGQISKDSNLGFFFGVQKEAKGYGVVFSGEKGKQRIIPAILNITKPRVITSEAYVDLANKDADSRSVARRVQPKSFESKLVFPIIQSAKTSNQYDGVIFEDIIDYSQGNQQIVFEPEQIHILGNKQDIEGFKKFVSGNGDVVFFSKEDEKNRIIEKFNLKPVERYGIKGFTTANDKITRKFVDNLISWVKENPIYNNVSVDWDMTHNLIVFRDKSTGAIFSLESMVPSKASPKTIALIKDFLKRIGVDAKSVQQIVVNGKKYDANGVALITQKLIQVVEGMEDVALPEEAMHFAVEIIKQTNPKLYNQLLKEINNYAIYKQVLAEYSTDKNYQTKDGKPNIQKLKEEAIGKVLAETIINKNEGTLEKPENIAKVQSWWSSMVEWFKSLFMKSGFDRAAMDILSGKEIGTAADIRAQEGSLFAQKTRQQSVVDKVKEINARLSKKEVEEKGEKKERYFLDGVTKVLKRVSDDIEEWYKRRFNGGDLLKSDYAKGVDDLKRGKGTLGHADKDYLLRGLNDGRGGILVDENGHLRDEPLDDSAYVSQIDPNDPDRKIYNILKANLWERLKSLDKTDAEGNRTVFLSEMQIYDPKQNMAGTMDLLAIMPDGTVNIYDWKFMALSDSYDDVPWYKVSAWKLQMDSYKTMLMNAYGVKPEQFGQTRMIPIKAVYSELDPKKKAMPRLLNVEIGAINPKDITDDYLIPVGVEEEKTGNEDVDNLLKKLNAEYRKLSEKTVLPTEKKTKAEQLNALFTAIRQLQMRQNIKPLLEQSKIFNSSIKRLMERYNNEWKGKDPKSFSEKEVNVFVKELIEAEKALKTYTTLDVDLADLFLEEESKELENDLSNTVKIARKLENTLDRVKTEFVRDFIGKAEGVENVVKEEKTISGLAKWWSDTATLQLNSAKILFRKVNRVLTKAAMDTVDESKKLLKIKAEYDKWARAKGLTNKNYFDILKKKGSNALIDEFQTQFYTELNTKINSRDPDLFKWVKENINISEYNAFLKEEIAKEKERIVEKYKNRESSEENRSKLENELNKVNKLYNTSTMDGLGWYQYDLIKRFPKEKWQTAEWKELHRKDAAGNYVNQPALDFYDYIRKRNEYYRSIGYLSRGEERTFLPWVKKSLVEKMVMGGKVSLGEQFLREISLDEGDVGYGNIDPHTGRPIDKLPKYFTTPINDQYSEDLFKTMSLYNEMAIKFNYLSTIEDQALALVDLERNKKTIATSIFSRTKYKDGKIEVSPDNSKNAELIESMVKGIVYGQKYLDNDNFDQALATFGKFGERVNAKLGIKIFPENLSGRTISLNKSINTLNRLFQMKAMGWNVLSASSNLFGGTIQSIINSGKYYTKSDYMSVEAWINAKMIGVGNEEYRKKAVGALEYFLPLTENYNREIAKKLSLSKFSQENIQDVLMYLMRQSDKHVQTVNFYSFLRNSIVQDGEVVNAREYLRSTPEYANLYEGTYDQKRKKEAQFEEDVKKLIEEKGVLTVGKIVDNEFVIPGVDRKSESVIALRRKIQQVSKDALGNMTEDSRRLIDMNIYGNSFMVFKNWIPRLVDVRVGDLKYNSASDAYEWGRMRMVFGMLSVDVLKSVRRLRNTLVGNEEGVKYMREMWEKKKEAYERETGKTLEMTEAEFMDLVRRNVRSQMTDTMFLLALIGLFAALKANAPDDDEDPLVKNQYKFLMKATDKLIDELRYFYNGSNILKLASGGIFPSLDLITNFEKIIQNFMVENYALVIGNEELKESNKVIKYVMKQFPILNQIQQYMPMFVPDVAKDLGIKAQSQSGFIQ